MHLPESHRCSSPLRDSCCYQIHYFALAGERKPTLQLYFVSGWNSEQSPIRALARHSCVVASWAFRSCPGTNSGRWAFTQQCPLPKSSPGLLAPSCISLDQMPSHPKEEPGGGEWVPHSEFPTSRRPKQGFLKSVAWQWRKEFILPYGISMSIISEIKAKWKMASYLLSHKTFILKKLVKQSLAFDISLCLRRTPPPPHAPNVHCYRYLEHQLRYEIKT